MSLDFRTIYAATGRLGAMLAERIDSNELRQTLDARAIRLAERAPAVGQRELLGVVLAVRRGRTLLGIDARAVQEVRRTTVVPLPHGTEYVPAVFQLRGEVICLLDCQPLFAPADHLPENRAATVVVVRLDGEALGLLVDEALGPRVVYADERDAAMQARAHPFVRAVTRDLLTVVDLERMLERMIVDRSS